MMPSFYKDEHSLCPHAREIEQLDRRRARGKMTAAEHEQAVRDLDPLDEMVIARMTAIAGGRIREGMSMGSGHYLSRRCGRRSWWRRDAA